MGEDRVIKKGDFARLNLGRSAPRCPLCHEFMERAYDHKMRVFIFKCDTPRSCLIRIDVNDPFVGRWDEALHNATGGEGIECPMAKTERACKGKMRYFATGTGYMQAVCPEKKCGAKISNGGTRKEGTVESATPDKLGIVQ